MLKNLDAPAMDILGIQMVVPMPNGNVKPMLLKDVIAVKLCNDGEKIPDIERIQRNKLAHKIIEGGDVDLTVDDIVMIKNVASKSCPISTIGAIHAALAD